MRKAELEKLLNRMASIGDQLSEQLELLESDPVISAYMKESDIPATRFRRSSWDTCIGELEQEGIIDSDEVSETPDERPSPSGRGYSLGH